MADLDSIQKRESGFGICLPFTRVGPTADGSDADSEDERAHLAMNYNGIATTAVVGNRLLLINPPGLDGGFGVGLSL